MNPSPPGLDLLAFERWVAAEHPELGTGWTATLIEGGRSNLTYSIQNDLNHLVLRRPPLGHVLATAHDMERETRVMRALQGSIPVPPVVAMVPAATSPLEAPFSLTRFVEGSVLRTEEDLAAISPETARERSEQLITTLAALHQVDIAAVGLETFGKPDGFLLRNVMRWCTQWESNKTRDIPAFDALGAQLQQQVPPSPPAAILHGDYRLDNTILATDRIAAVVDWEMSTLGDPLTDLALMCCYWTIPSDVVMPGVARMSPELGFMTQEELLSRYAMLTGTDLSNFSYYQSYAIFKLAVILEGINARFQAGQTVGSGFDAMRAAVDRLAEWGNETRSAL